MRWIISKSFKKIIAVVVLLAIWQVAAMVIDKRVLLASPVDVAVRLFALVTEEGFWSTVAFSFVRIAGGFLCGLLFAVILAILAARFEWVEILLSPLMVTIKTVPVASFIILALIWMTSGNLSMFISFLMVLPVIYNNLLRGFKSKNAKMEEMADVYKLSYKTRVKYIYIPTIYPFLLAGCEIGLGLAWKAGVAAEVIGIPNGSIGEQMYMSKVYLDTASLFAWTVIIVLISVLFEKLVISLIKVGYEKYCS